MQRLRLFNRETLPVLLRTIARSGSTVSLEFRSGTQRIYLTFREGQLEGAVVGELEGTAALRLLLRQRDGQCTEVGELIPTSVPFHQPLEELLALASFSGATVLRPVISGSERLPYRCWEVLTWLDGQRTLAEVAGLSGLSLEQTVQIAERLSDLGVVESPPPPERQIPLGGLRRAALEVLGPLADLLIDEALEDLEQEGAPALTPPKYAKLVEQLLAQLPAQRQAVFRRLVAESAADGGER